MNTLVTLGYRPFIDPISTLWPGAHDHWYWLLLPLALGVSVVYKAARVRTMDRYLTNVALMTAQIVLGMIALGAAFFFLVEIYVRWITSS